MASPNLVGLIKHSFPITNDLSHAANLKVDLGEVELRRPSNSRRDRPFACFNALENYVTKLETHQRPYSHSLSVRFQARKVKNGIEFLIWVNRAFLQELCRILPNPSLLIQGTVVSEERTEEPLSFKHRFRVQDLVESATSPRILIMHVWSHDLLFTPAPSTSRMLDLTVSVGWIRFPRTLMKSYF